MEGKEMEPLQHVTGVWKPQVRLFNKIIDRINSIHTSNESLCEVLNEKFEATLGGKFEYDRTTGEWSWTPSNVEA